jgi:hypothetical protein
MTNQQTPWSRGFQEKLIVPQLVKFLAYCRTLRFITVSKRARHLSLSRLRTIQSTSPSCFLNIRYSIIHQSTPWSSKWSPSHKFPYQNTFCITRHPYTCHLPCPSHFSWLFRWMLQFNCTRGICGATFFAAVPFLPKEISAAATQKYAVAYT